MLKDYNMPAKTHKKRKLLRELLFLFYIDSCENQIQKINNYNRKTIPKIKSNHLNSSINNITTD